MFCDLSLASFEAVDDALDSTDVEITDTAAVDEDFNDADANDTNDDDDGDDDDDDGDSATDGVGDNDFDDANTNNDNDADADCEINDVVISDVVSDKDGVTILDDDSSDVNGGVVSGTKLPT